MVLDAVTQVELFVNVFISVYAPLVFLYILTSWIKLPYSLNPVQRFLSDVLLYSCAFWRRSYRRWPTFHPLSADGGDLRAGGARPDPGQRARPTPLGR